MSERVGAFIAVLALGACTHEAVRLTAGKSDTIVVNGRAPTSLAVEVLDSRGDSVLVDGLRYEWMSGDSIPVTSRGLVVCSRRADATVRVSTGHLATDFVVQCRPIRGFFMPWEVRLVLGGPSSHLNVGAIGLDGQPLPSFAGTAAVRDNQIARLQGLEIFPVGVGVTIVDLDVGECSMPILIDVDSLVGTPAALATHRIFAQRVALVPGEIRSWQIPPGFYELWLGPESLVEPTVGLVSRNTNCVHVAGEGKRYLCVALPDAEIVLRDTRRLRSGKALTVGLSLRMESERGDYQTDDAKSARTADRRARRCTIEDLPMPRFGYAP
jgi:hypothetical protein